MDDPLLGGIMEAGCRETGLRRARNAIPFYIVDPVAAVRRPIARLKEVTMSKRFKALVIVAALGAGTSSAAMAQYACAPGYTYYNGVCQPVRAPGYSNLVSGAVSGEAAGAASGYATGGPLGTATGAVTGTANALTGAPATSICGPGFNYYNGACYPIR
jgi:hypothetical protein